MTAITGLSTARAAVRGALAPSRVDVALYGTPLLLLLNVRDDRVLVAIVAAATVAIVLSERVRTLPWFWLGLAAVVGARQTSYFVTLDDHVVLTTYWCAAVGLALLATDCQRVLSLSAGLLIGIAFAFAALWKLTSGEFLDGRFFRFTLIWDPRFEHLTDLTGQADPRPAREALDTLVAARRPGRVVAWPEGPRSNVVGLLMTWWAVYTEVFVAAGFLLPWRGMPWLRHTALFTFMVGTYLVVPITGFGALLSVMAAVNSDSVRWRRAYVIAFVVLLLVWPPMWRVLTGYEA